VVWYEARHRGVCGPIRHLPVSKGRTPETNQIIATSKDSRMEMGRNRNGLHSWVTSYSSWIWFDMGYNGSLNKGCTFHPSKDNLFWSSACGVVHVKDHVFTWSPKKIMSDRGSQFTSKFWEKLHESMDTKLNFSSTYHPQTDGQTERTNQILEDILRACALKYGKSWGKSLPYTEFSYNNSYQASIEMAPFEALYGR
jgi:hypothetical protein